MAAGYGAGVGAYAEQLLNSPLPWTRMRQVYRLLGMLGRQIVGHPGIVGGAHGIELDMFPFGHLY